MASPIIDLRGAQDAGASAPDQVEKEPASAAPIQSPSLLAWEAPEFILYEKTTLWYVSFGILFALLLFAAYLLQSFLTAVVFFLCGILFFFYSERVPKMTSYEIRNDGVGIHGTVYRYRDLIAFNIVEHGNEQYVLLHNRRILNSIIHVPMADTVDIEDVRTLLLRHIPQDENFLEPLPDVLAHWIGF